MSPAFLFSTAPRRLQRLREMTLAEVATRARQKASSWLDRTRMSAPAWPAPDRVLAQRAPALAAPDAAARLGSSLERRFFAGAVDPRTPAHMGARFPSETAAIIASADRILKQRFDLLGYEQLSFGDPVDWHWDPVADQRAPICHWSVIDPLDWAAVGDNKVIWELNRHQWLVTLAQAALITGEARYAAAAGESVDSWLDANPRGIGINWASSLELAYRLISWCWTLALLRETDFMTRDRFARMAAAIWAQARHVERYLSVYFSPNTHLTGEALGLFYAGVLFPEFTDAERWRATGRSILETELHRQLLSDGVNFEQATCYHRYTLEIYLHFAALAERNGVALPQEVDDAIERAHAFLSDVTINGAMARIGDDDGGWLLPLVRRGSDDSRGVLDLAAAWLGRHSGSSAAIEPETLWLLGSATVASNAVASARSDVDRGSRLYTPGGYVIMRARSADTHLIFDVGPLGCPNSGGHGHADLLSIQCAAFGETFIVDPGTYCYTPEPAWRDYFRSSAAHSTVVVDGVSQAEPAGPFAWHDRPSARLRDFQQTPTFDLADADHDAYARLDDPVRHRRRVLFVKRGYWVVVDDLLGAHEHTAEARFQFSPLDIVRGPAPWFLSANSNGGGLWIGGFADVPLAATVRAGEVDPIEGWISTAYGRRRPAPVVVYRAIGRFPVRIVTLLLPVREVTDVPRIHVSRARQQFVIEVEETGQRIVVNDQEITVDPCTP